MQILTHVNLKIFMDHNREKEWQVRQELQEYEDFLEDLVSNKKSRIFTNRSIEHAATSMSKMFKYTNDIVRMYCNGLDPKITEQESYLSFFRKLLEDPRRIRLNLLVCTTDFINGKAFQKVIDTKKERNDDTIKIRKITPENRDKLNKSFDLDNCNLSIFDNDKYRLEIDPDKYTAIGSFNDEDSTKKLINRFDEAFDCAEII